MTEDTLKAGEKILQSIHFTPPTPVSTNSIYLKNCFLHYRIQRMCAQSLSNVWLFVTLWTAVQ